MIEHVVAELGPWNWMLLGFVLLAAEILAPGVFLLWIGIAAILTGTLSLQLWDAAMWTWHVQVLVFLALSLLSAYGGKRFMDSRRNEETPFSGFDILIPVLVVLVVLLLFAGIKTVPQGFNFTVERFGRYTKTLTPGLNIIVPFIDRVGAKMNMMEQVLDVPTQEVITRDNAIVAVDGVAFYQVLTAAEAAYQVSGLENAILNLTMTNIRSVMGSMDLDELLSNRDAINEKLLRIVDDAASPWGIKMTRVEIKDINPPANLVESMARQMMAERNKRAQILEAEGLKQAEILEAEGRKEAAFRDAEARERAAEAEARATQVVSDAIAAGDVHAVNYFVAQKYTDALATIGSSNNNKVVLMPLEASSLIGSLGGIGAIAREVFSDGNTAPAPKNRASSARPPRTGPAQE